MLQLTFPVLPPEIKVVESSLLSGAAFTTIVTVLVVLLVIIVAVDGFIIYSMKTGGQGGETAGSVASNRKAMSLRGSQTSMLGKSRKSGGTPSSGGMKSSKSSKSKSGQVGSRGSSNTSMTRTSSRNM